MREKTLKLLGLMRRAGAISPGEDQGGEAVRTGKAKLLLFSADVSDNARRKAENLSEGRNVQLLFLPFDREELGRALGLGSCSLAAVTDLGFAQSLMKLLSAQWPEDYAAAAQAVRERAEKAAERKARKGSKRTRRTNV